MSKLVVKIRDDDENFPCCPLEHEGYCHLPQTHYRLGNALYMIECLGIINKRPPWCPLKEEKEAIPVEWIKKYARHKASRGFTEIDCYWPSWEEDVHKMLEDWEKENGKAD